MDTLVIGSILANGATLLVWESAPISDNAATVLALWHGEFVTWMCNVETRECFWGHYFGSDLEAAISDFKARANK